MARRAPREAGARENLPVLELDRARPVFDEDRGLPQVPYSLRLMPGDCVLVETTSARRAAALADLCGGLLALAGGAVRFLGLDWEGLGDAQANALRGRIGRIHGDGAWTVGRGADHDILLPRLHHTRANRDRLVAEALALARRFGLPGLPVEPGDRMAEADAARAACVRAFLGTPSLLILENPVTAANPGLLLPLLRAVTDARERGAAVLVLTRERELWRRFHPFLTARLRLLHHGMQDRDNARDARDAARDARLDHAAADAAPATLRAASDGAIDEAAEGAEGAATAGSEDSDA